MRNLLLIIYKLINRSDKESIREIVTAQVYCMYVCKTSVNYLICLISHLSYRK